MKRALSPATNAPGLMAAAAAIYAAVVMIVHVVHHQGVIDPQVIVSALAAAAALYTRFVVTPVADPKDGNGKPLAAAPAPIAGNGTPSPEAAAQARWIIDYIRSTYGVPPETAVAAGKVTAHDPMQRPGTSA